MITRALKTYLIVYCDYEGIGEIHGPYRKESVALYKLKKLRESSEEPERYCIMKTGKSRPVCACSELGVPMGLVLY